MGGRGIFYELFTTTAAAGRILWRSVLSLLSLRPDWASRPASWRELAGVMCLYGGTLLAYNSAFVAALIPINAPVDSVKVTLILSAMEFSYILATSVAFAVGSAAFLRRVASWNSVAKHVSPVVPLTLLLAAHTISELLGAVLLVASSPETEHVESVVRIALILLVLIEVSRPRPAGWTPQGVDKVRQSAA